MAAYRCGEVLMGRLASVGTAMVKVAGDTDVEMSLYFRVLTGEGN